MSASPLTIIPSHAGQNLADLKPLLKLGEGEKKPSSSLTEAIQERHSHYSKLEDQTFKDLISAGQEAALFLQGEQFLMPNPFVKGGWLPYKIQGTGTAVERRALSQMQIHVSGNLEKWCNSQPDVRVRPGVDSDEAREAAEGAKIIVDHYESKFYEARVHEEECLQALTFGSYLWRLKVDPTLKGVTAYRQIFENREVKIGKGWGKCGDCSNEGSAEDFNAVGDGTYSCPKCHGEALVIPPASDVVPTEVDREPVELGDFRLDLIPFAQTRWDLRYHADESPWLIISRRTTGSALRQILGNIKIPEGGGSNFGLDTVDRLAYSGQARAGYGGSTTNKTSLYKDPATVDEFWMSPDIYGDIRLEHDVETVSGQVLKANILLGEQLRGQTMVALGLNGMSAVIGFFPENHQEYVVQGKWYAKTGTGVGRGLQDLVEVQKVFNSDHQQIHTYLRSTATPAMLVASEVLGEEDKARYIGSPNTNIPFSLAALSEGIKPEDLVRPAFQPGNVSGQMFEFVYNRLNEQAQFASHFLPFTSGLPGVDNKTATGANITQAATNALYTPVLSIKGEIRRLVAEKLIKLYPRHFPIERYFPLGGKFQQHTGKSIKGANLNTALLFEVVADSWNPRNSYIKRQDYMGFVGMFGGVAGWLQARQIEPDRVADMERTFDLELESEVKNVAESLCFRRVRQMQQAASLIQDPAMLVGVEQIQDPNTGATQLIPTGQGVIQPPVSKAEPAHTVKRKWLMEWLDSDDGQMAVPHLRAAVELLILLHTMFDGEQSAMLAGQAGAVQVAGQAPAQLAQQGLQAAQAEERMRMQQQQQETALHGEVAKLGLEAGKKDLEHEHLQRTNDEKRANKDYEFMLKAAQETR